MKNDLKYIDEFVDYGLDGIEVYHPAQNKSARKTLKKIAATKSLLVSGGSDYHGRAGHHEMIASQNVPYELWHAIKNKWNNKNEV